MKPPCILDNCFHVHKGKLDGSIGERKFKVFNDFDIQPVFTYKTNSTPPGLS